MDLQEVSSPARISVPVSIPVVILIVVLALTALPAPAQQSVPPEVIAKNLAENVLGENTVRSVRVTRNGRIIEITWDAVLYRRANSKERNREQLRGEAELATGSIMGVMRPDMIRYRMLLGRLIIASGTRSREGGFSIMYAKALDG